MTVSAGTRLGPYEILAPLGAGGMGEVYRARDTSLKREVALKVLPDAVAADPERLARFQREAEVLAALNHPHIAHVYGLDRQAWREGPDGTASAATVFIVLELVDGEDLAAHIARGPLPIDEALAIARQIADALDAAHEKGIVHRDLKPANIMLTRGGQVKVLDFGLAKIDEGSVRPGGPGEPGGATHSPTLTLAGTAVGVIVGTAAYMSPEQAKGRPADKRSDVWAFGCVLYELLTGRRAFEGVDVASTLARVLERDPDWARLPK